MEYPGKVLILCTGNSCRSQMAEGLINHDLVGRWEAVSAGTEPSGYVHPLAIRAMTELNIDISAGVSKSAAVFQNVPLDIAVTVCDDANEHCPIWLGDGQVIHIGFDDPARATGTDEEKMAVFRRVRDEIRLQVVGFLAERLDEEDLTSTSNPY